MSKPFNLLGAFRFGFRYLVFRYGIRKFAVQRNNALVWGKIYLVSLFWSHYITIWIISAEHAQTFRSVMRCLVLLPQDRKTECLIWEDWGFPSFLSKKIRTQTLWKLFYLWLMIIYQICKTDSKRPWWHMMAGHWKIFKKSHNCVQYLRPI